MVRLSFMAAGLLAAAACAGCVVYQGKRLPRDAEAVPLADIRQIALLDTPQPLPLRVPIKGVMAGVVEFSAHGVFTSAISEMPLTEDDWLAAGLASINLIGSATLITLPGTGPHDAEWVADPDYRRWAEAMQLASISAGAATVRKDRAGLLAAANRIAIACQSCHAMYRPDIPSAASQFAAIGPATAESTP
ncbi:MAG: hypothetical protein Q8R02_17645 [Hyphomonadaceae bacterium]|nr:hypothetical protein [Hyphomonadaceae bacterium]